MIDILICVLYYMQLIHSHDLPTCIGSTKFWDVSMYPRASHLIYPIKHPKLQIHIYSHEYVKENHDKKANDMQMKLYWERQT